MRQDRGADFLSLGIGAVVLYVLWRVFSGATPAVQNVTNVLSSGQ